ncbi:outer membrane channel protein TolC [Motilimonas cestriensis]|uniref:Outer membrane channel protein TolC n=1 Tax=Motilimonas cestriensis TaxID=2742685 RepID=A0ABS8WA68_9GAMM|nr:outer membrane channel protein TolC [Motilimonas cestriensis]MCE2595921.1 outer membrane channel protein TolC [Motilimonas cestriensis]
MKRTLLSIATLVGLSSLSSLALADDIQQIYQQAKTKDPLILQALANRDSAFEKINESRASLLPQIGLGLNASYTVTNKNNAGTKSDLGGQVQLSQALYREDYWTSLTLTEKAATQADAIYGSQAQQLILRTSKAYFDVLRAKDALSAVEANKRAVARQLEQTKQRFEVGLTAITDVHEAQAEHDRTLANEIQARNALTNSYEALRELTGVEVREIDELNIDRFSPIMPEGNSALWLTKAENENLQLHTQRIAKDIAKTQIELAETGNSPTVDFVAGVGVNNSNYKNNNPSDGTLSNGNVGVNFSMPLYTGGAVSSRAKQAQFSYVAASEELERIYRNVQTEIRSNYNNVGAAISTIKAYEQTVVSSESALKATEAGFEVGTRTIVDVLDATRKLYQSKELLSNARYDYILSMLNLKFAAGDLTEIDIATINAGLQPPTSK